MSEEKRALLQEEKRDYFRAWRARNPDKARIYNERYWEKRIAARLQDEQATA